MSTVLMANTSFILNSSALDESLIGSNAFTLPNVPYTIMAILIGLCLVMFIKMRQSKDPVLYESLNDSSMHDLSGHRLSFKTRQSKDLVSYESLSDSSSHDLSGHRSTSLQNRSGAHVRFMQF